jgi:hypothetical protein
VDQVNWHWCFVLLCERCANPAVEPPHAVVQPNRGRVQVGGRLRDVRMPEHVLDCYATANRRRHCDSLSQAVKSSPPGHETPLAEMSSKPSALFDMSGKGLSVGVRGGMVRPARREWRSLNPCAHHSSPCEEIAAMRAERSAASPLE